MKNIEKWEDISEILERYISENYISKRELEEEEIEHQQEIRWAKEEERERIIDEAIEYVKSKPTSMIGRRIKKMEGVVGTPKQRLLDIFGHRIIVKVKVRDFIT